jgi:hypothetical protein
MKTPTIVALSDLKSVSFVPPIRDRIEEVTQENLRALLEDDPKKWLEALADILQSVSALARKQASIYSDEP